MTRQSVERLLLDELDDRELLELLELEGRDELELLDERLLLELDGALLELDDRELLELDDGPLDESEERELLLAPGEVELADDPARFAWFTPSPLPSASSADGEVGLPPAHPIMAPLAVTSVAPPDSRIKKSRRLDEGSADPVESFSSMAFGTAHLAVNGATRQLRHRIRRRRDIATFRRKNTSRYDE